MHIRDHHGPAAIPVHRQNGSKNWAWTSKKSARTAFDGASHKLWCGAGPPTEQETGTTTARPVLQPAGPKLPFQP
tara:strand:- start:247 stop:471 length:225 start_codon:yes stop_codon:yes gene_type:complete